MTPNHEIVVNQKYTIVQNVKRIVILIVKQRIGFVNGFVAENSH